MKKLFLAAALLAGFTGFGQKQKQKEVDVATKYAETITPAALKEKLSIIAAPEMEGRETASAGQRRAAAYIESVFQKLRLLPGTTGGYQMQFPIYQDTLIEASLKVNDKAYALNTDFSLNIAAATNGNFDINEIIFATYGIADSARNDYAKLDVKDKWVLVLEGAPDGTPPADRRSPYSNYAKLETAKKMGARGIFVMSADFPKKSPVALKGNMTLQKATTTSVQMITVSPDLAHSLLGLDPSSLLESINIIPTGSYKSNTRITVYKRTMMLQSSNVIGILPGTDKKDEYVLVTGHYDHLGRKGNEIFYGADDDGSGTTSVLQIAEAFVKARNDGQPQRRTLVFMTVSGEEKGLLGSEFFSQYPSFPLDKTVADLNIDMVGRIDPTYKGDLLNYLYVIGDDKLSSDLAPITDSVNKRYVNLQLDRRFNDLKDSNRFYYRSDHYNFAKKGVPVIFYFNGTHADYHRSSDTVDKINFDLMAKRVRLVFYTAWEMANRNEAIKRDIALPK